MADTHSKEVRSKNMSHIRSTNTKPEETVRKYLFSADFGTERMYENFQDVQISYFLNIKRLSSVNGCFWHMHDCGRFGMAVQQ